MLPCTRNTFRSMICGRAAIGYLLQRQKSMDVICQRTPLYDFHVKSGGKMVNFGGFELPVQYADQGITASHLHTRAHGSLFDVSHMLQTYVRGKNAIDCVESICTGDIKGLTDGSGILTVFTNQKGGILDDLIVTKVNSELLYIVSNAAMKAQDKSIMESAVSEFKALKKDVAIEFLSSEEQSLIALQGPKAVDSLGNLLSPAARAQLSHLYFMNTTVCEIAGVPDCRVTRCGYTGEDGVEISVSSGKIQKVVEALLGTDHQLKMAGLGARDSLRIEAGLCLYGTDINSDITPIEAGLTWLVGKRRRSEFNFPGSQIICDQIKNGVNNFRVGLQMLGDNSQPPARNGFEIYHNNKVVGKITSGCPSPSLKKNIAMGYVNSNNIKPCSRIQLKIRGKFYEAEIVKMPFVKSHYYTNKK